MGASFSETAKNLYSQQCLNSSCVDIEEDGVRHTQRPHLHVDEEEATLTCCAFSLSTAEIPKAFWSSALYVSLCSCSGSFQCQSSTTNGLAFLSNASEKRMILAGEFLGVLHCEPLPPALPCPGCHCNPAVEQKSNCGSVRGGLNKTLRSHPT